MLRIVLARRAALIPIVLCTAMMTAPHAAADTCPDGTKDVVTIHIVVKQDKIVLKPFGSGKVTVYTDASPRKVCWVVDDFGGEGRTLHIGTKEGKYDYFPNTGKDISQGGGGHSSANSGFPSDLEQLQGLEGLGGPPSQPRWDWVYDLWVTDATGKRLVTRDPMVIIKKTP